MSPKCNIFTIIACLLFISVVINAQNIPSPKEHFGFEIGDDYHLATYTQTESYFKKLAAASPKAKYNIIGKTEEGRDQFMMVVTSPENHQKLEYYKSISQNWVTRMVFQIHKPELWQLKVKQWFG